MLEIIISFFKYLKIFQKFTKGGIYLSFFLTTIAGLSEGLGIILLLPIVQSISGNAVKSETGISKFIFLFLEKFNINESYGVILLLITLAFIIKAFLIFSTYTYNSYLKGKLIKDLKKKIFSSFSKISYQYYLQNNIGDLTNILNEQVNLSVRGFNSLYTVGLRGINCIIYLFFACLLAGKAGLLSILGSFIILFLFRWLNTATKTMSINTSKANSKLANLTIESLQAFKYLKATEQFRIKVDEAEESIKELSDYQTKTSILEGFTSACREPIAVVVIMFILLVQLYFIKKPIDSLLVSLILFYRGLISTLGVQGSWQKTQEYLGSFEMVISNLKSLVNNYENDGNKLVKNFKYIEFSNVFFKYTTKDSYSLKNLSLIIPAKKSIAFVGASGAGKSTIANLICLLLKPNKGDINIDKINLKNIDKNSWRSQIGYVSQEMAIFDNTIGYNISLNKNYRKEKKLIAKIKENAIKASIDDFIQSLPDGYETRVGENGLRLSGGQKQRLFIARELFREPKLLILDEATSSLDTLSEKAIKKSIDLLKGEITIILIAHRISTIKDSDFIYVIDKGNILEKGNYLTLKSKKDSFFNYLISSQKL